MVSIPFLKMHGLGNDFVILDARGKEADSVFADKADLSRQLGDRHFGAWNPVFQRYNRPVAKVG